MSQAIDSGGAAIEKKTQKKRNKIIKDATDELNDNKISVLEFLNRVTCKREQGIMNMAHFEVPSGYFSDDDNEEDDECIETNDNCIIDRHIDENLCIICYDRKKNVIYLPCRHQKYCEECSSQIAARVEGKFDCPFCKQTVEDTIVAFI